MLTKWYGRSSSRTAVDREKDRTAATLLEYWREREEERAATLDKWDNRPIDVEAIFLDVCWIKLILDLGVFNQGLTILSTEPRSIGGFNKGVSWNTERVPGMFSVTNTNLFVASILVMGEVLDGKTVEDGRRTEFACDRMGQKKSNYYLTTIIRIPVHNHHHHNPLHINHDNHCHIINNCFFLPHGCFAAF